MDNLLYEFEGMLILTFTYHHTLHPSVSTPNMSSGNRGTHIVHRMCDTHNLGQAEIQGLVDAMEVFTCLP